MAAPLYTTDLTTLAIGSITVDSGTWDESSDGGWDTGGAMVDDANLYYNGSACVSAQLTKDSNGSGNSGPATIMYTDLSTFTVPADGAILVHHLWAAPPALNTLANGGIKVLVGSGLGAFYAWNVSGNDFAPAPRGGWANYAINPNDPSGTTDAHLAYDALVGSPASPWDTVGMAVAATAQARGNPNAVNAIRYGRCISIYEFGDAGNGYATFDGYATVDSNPNNKWNLLDPVKGGFEHQGLMSLGTTTNAVDFRDSNKSVSIANTIKVTPAFNKIEVHNVASNIEWTNIIMTALGTISKGSFEVVDDAIVSKSGCVFTDMDTFTYKSNSTVTKCTYRRTNTISVGGGSLVGCLITESTAAISVSVADLVEVDGCTFESSGSNHAVELTSVGTGSMTWNCNTSGYDSGSSGSPVVPTNTGNEDIYVSATSGTITINVASGTTIPSIRSAGATVNVVAGLVSFIFTTSPPIVGYEWRIYVDSGIPGELGTTELAGEETAASDVHIYSYTYTADVNIVLQLIATGYEEVNEYYTLTAADKNVTITLKPEENI